jgi:hypothetical protein
MDTEDTHARSGGQEAGRQAGNSGTGADAGDAFRGAILPFRTPTSISSSTFDHNEAIGGNNGNCGLGQQDPAVDSGFGGAITTGFTATVTNSSFSHNEAIGGNNATATGTDIMAVGVGGAGAIARAGKFAGKLPASVPPAAQRSEVRPRTGRAASSAVGGNSSAP